MYTFERLAAAGVLIYYGPSYCWIGRVSCENRNGIIFVHYNLDAEHRRKGLISTALDIARATFDDVRFCDDPDYQILGGNGFMTEDGQAFADGYRLKNNIPLPPSMWANVGWGRGLVNRYEDNRLAA